MGRPVGWREVLGRKRDSALWSFSAHPAWCSSSFPDLPIKDEPGGPSRPGGGGRSAIFLPRFFPALPLLIPSLLLCSQIKGFFSPLIFSFDLREFVVMS